MAFLEIKDLKSGYSGRTIIDGVSFSIEKGEFVGIIGPNGAGKTTLLKTMTHILSPSGGGVFLEGKDVHRLNSTEMARRFAMVGQDLRSIFSFTVKDIVLMGRTPYIGLFNSETGDDLKMVDHVLELTDLKDFIERPIDELSAGERQRVLIAKALAQDPAILLLDEPTAHLDIGYQMEILELVRSLKRERQLTVVCVLHDLNLASQYCNRIILLDKGKVADFAPPKDILKYDTIEKIFGATVLVNEKALPGSPLVVPIARSRS